jgi:hypothetical protein
MPVALSLPTTLKTHRVAPVNPILKSFIVWIVGMFFWLIPLLPDPKVSFTEQMEGLSKTERIEREKNLQNIDKKYAPYFTAKHANDWVGMSCPYHRAMVQGTIAAPGKHGSVPET